MGRLHSFLHIRMAVTGVKMAGIADHTLDETFDEAGNILTGIAREVKKLPSKDTESESLYEADRRKSLPSEYIDHNLQDRNMKWKKSLHSEYIDQNLLDKNMKTPIHHQQGTWEKKQLTETSSDNGQNIFTGKETESNSAMNDGSVVHSECIVDEQLPDRNTKEPVQGPQETQKKEQKGGIEMEEDKSSGNRESWTECGSETRVLVQLDHNHDPNKSLDLSSDSEKEELYDKLITEITHGQSMILQLILQKMSEFRDKRELSKLHFELLKILDKSVKDTNEGFIVIRSQMLESLKQAGILYSNSQSPTCSFLKRCLYSIQSYRLINYISETLLTYHKTIATQIKEQRLARNKIIERYHHLDELYWSIQPSSGIRDLALSRNDWAHNSYDKEKLKEFEKKYHLELDPIVAEAVRKHVEDRKSGRFDTVPPPTMQSGETKSVSFALKTHLDGFEKTEFPTRVLDIAGRPRVLKTWTEEDSEEMTEDTQFESETTDDDTVDSMTEDAINESETPEDEEMTLDKEMKGAEQEGNGVTRDKKGKVRMFVRVKLDEEDGKTNRDMGKVCFIGQPGKEKSPFRVEMATMDGYFWYAEAWNRNTKRVQFTILSTEKKTLKAPSEFSGQSRKTDNLSESENVLVAQIPKPQGSRSEEKLDSDIFQAPNPTSILPASAAEETEKKMTEGKSDDGCVRVKLAFPKPNNKNSPLPLVDINVILTLRMKKTLPSPSNQEK